MNPAPRRTIAPDRYWHLRHLVSEALRARDQAQYAHSLHVQAQAKVDDAIKAAGLDPSRPYTFNDAELTLEAAPAAPVVQLPNGAPPSASPLAVLAETEEG